MVNGRQFVHRIKAIVLSNLTSLQVYNSSGCISSLRTLLICGALEPRRPEAVHAALTRSSSIDFIEMRTLWRQYTEVCESELPMVPKIDFLVSKLALAF